MDSQLLKTTAGAKPVSDFNFIECLMRKFFLKRGEFKENFWGKNYWTMSVSKKIYL